jgi:hypothetical protein
MWLLGACFSGPGVRTASCSLTRPARFNTCDNCGMIFIITCPGERLKLQPLKPHLAPRVTHNSGSKIVKNIGPYMSCRMMRTTPKQRCPSQIDPGPPSSYHHSFFSIIRLIERIASINNHIRARHKAARIAGQKHRQPIQLINPAQSSLRGQRLPNLLLRL